MHAHPAEVPVRECLELVRHQQFGRVCVLDRATPLAFPVAYRVQGDEHTLRLVLRTSPVSLIGRYEGPASIEVDEIDAAAGTAWSVILRGRLRRAPDGADLPLTEPWNPSSRHQWMVLEVDQTTGRRFVSSSGTDGYSVDWAVASN
jgi:nitroimidazol reductase NimA-like FMN-containing flavoprotein (pyridoxamine 5'-phosphate oxidase superfamily)